MVFIKMTFEIIAIKSKTVLLLCHPISTTLGNVHIAAWESQECSFRPACWVQD